MCHSIPRPQPWGWNRNDCISAQFDIWSALCSHIFLYILATLTFPPNLHFGVATSSYGLEAYHLLNVKNEFLFYLRNRKLAHYKGRRIVLLVNQSKFNKDVDFFGCNLPNKLLRWNLGGCFVCVFIFLRIVLQFEKIFRFVEREPQRINAIKSRLYHSTKSDIYGQINH